MPTQEALNKLRKRRLAQRKAVYREALQDAKSQAITPDLFLLWRGVDRESPRSLAETLAEEHRYFENDLTAAETERFSKRTAVGIGQETRGRNKGCYPLVLNLLKTLSDGVPGLGFPGGRVRLGETPAARVQKEYLEESGLIPEIINPDQPVAKHKVGEEEHEFLAYEVKIIGGKAKPAFSKGEQIVSIVFIEEETLTRVCRTDGRIMVKGFGPVGVLRSHRLAFLEYLRKKEKEKTAQGVVEEEAHV